MAAFAWHVPRNLRFGSPPAEITGVVESAAERAEHSGTAMRLVLIATAVEGPVTAGGQPVAPGDRVVLWCRGRDRKAMTDAANRAGGLRAGSRLTVAYVDDEPVAEHPGTPRKVKTYRVEHGQTHA